MSKGRDKAVLQQKFDDLLLNLDGLLRLLKSQRVDAWAGQIGNRVTAMKHEVLRIKEELGG